MRYMKPNLSRSGNAPEHIKGNNNTDKATTPCKDSSPAGSTGSTVGAYEIDE